VYWYRVTLLLTSVSLIQRAFHRSDHMPVYAAFNSCVARVDVESRAQVARASCILCSQHMQRTILYSHVLLQAMKQLLLETDKRENQCMPKVSARSIIYDCDCNWIEMPLTLPQVSCSPSDGLSTHLAYGETQSMRLTV
jgi:hypothetical protein